MKRYSRQTIIEGFGKEGQKRLSESKVLIVGCGALGSMVAMQLTAAGIGTLGIADFDTVDVSNLQRQFFFDENNAGQKKTVVLKYRLENHNKEVKILVYDELITKKNYKPIFDIFDYIVDATDNPSSKYLISSVCQNISKPCCIGGISGLRGQIVTQMNLGSSDEGLFANLFYGMEESGILPCEMEGVLGPAAALCASLQSSEVIKYLTGISDSKKSILLTFDLRTNEFHTYEL